jgi:drug/metabolite transporter (DMT)-like permease
MDGATFLVLIGCAAATALLNCALKHQPDPLAGALLLAICGGVSALPLLLLTGLPSVESMPLLAVSVLLALLYWIFLGNAYASGDVSIVFPLAYGSAPALVLLMTSLLIKEYPSANQLAVILLISAGLLLVLFSGTGLPALANRRMLALCAALVAVICAYTIIDALGARLSGSTLAYTAAIYAGNSVATLVYGLFRHRQRLARAAASGWRPAVFWGAASMFIYSGELWAMTRAPIALVAALRESSILFAALFAILWLKEPLRPSRIAGAGVVALGLMMMRLA